MYLHQSVNKYTVIYTCVNKAMTFCRCVKEDHAHLHLHTSWNVWKLKSGDVED